MPLDSEGAGHKALPILAQRQARRELRAPGAQVYCHTSGWVSLLATRASATTQPAAGANISKKAWGHKSCDGGAQKSGPQALKVLFPPNLMDRN